MKKDLDIIYNLEYLVIVPKMTKDLYENIHETFENTILIDNNVEDLNFIIDFINKNNFRQLIFVDFQEEYTQIINGLNNLHEIKFIYTGSLGALSDPFKFYIFNGLYKFYSSKIEYTPNARITRRMSIEMMEMANNNTSFLNRRYSITGRNRKSINSLDGFFNPFMDDNDQKYFIQNR